MVTYEYKCGTHGVFELKQPMDDEHGTTTCFECGSLSHRVYSMSGWIYDHPKPLFHEDGSYEEK